MGPLALLLAGCSAPVSHPFPDDFTWGSATAGFQVEMGCGSPDCVDPASDWYQYVTDPLFLDNNRLHVAGQPVGDGPGMWDRYAEDVAQMQADHHGGFRMSLEWSRLFPDGAAESATTVAELSAHADPAAVARYHAWLGALRDAGIEPFVTLNHYTLPLWVHDGADCHVDPACTASGWLDSARITPLIALYAGFCAQEFGGRVDRWATLNEPLATTLSGFLLPGEARSAPPGLSDAIYAIPTLYSQIEASAAMYDAVHAEDTVDADGDGTAAQVGLVLNMVDIVPLEADDELAVTHMDWLYHRLFLDGLTDGSWDDDLDGVWDRTRPELAGRMDFLGINYYNRIPVNHVGFNLAEGIPLFDFIPQFNWDPAPEGLAHVVARASEYELPIVISENGTPEVADSEQILVEHLLALHGAIEGGADVGGYYYWSWVDNYEWNHGMAMRFGLYALDTETKARTARPVARRLALIAKQKGVDSDAP